MSAWLYLFVSGLFLFAEPVLGAKHPSELGFNPPYFTTNHGVLEPRPEHDEHEPECSRYLRLGAGQAGVAHRINRFDKILNRKTLRDKTDRNSDVFLLQNYEEAQNAGHDLGFRFPHVWTEDGFKDGVQTGARYHYYEDLGARELAEILWDTTVPQEIRDYLLESYVQRLGRWEDFVRRQWKGTTEGVQSHLAHYDELRAKVEQYHHLSNAYDIPAHDRGNRCFRFPYRWLRAQFVRQLPDGGTSHFSGTLMIKADAIVVHPVTLEMYLIDPQ